MCGGIKVSDLDNKFYQCLGNFDFDKVKNVMEFLNWRWSFPDGMRVPEKSEMVDKLLELWNQNKEVFEKRILDNVSTGGFVLEAGTDIDNAYVHIYFVVETQEF